MSLPLPFSAVSKSASAHPIDLKLRARAYRLLAAREHSAWELRRKLTAVKCLPEAEQAVKQAAIERLLTELAEQDAQSDFRFAEQRCRWRYQKRSGPVKLRHELAEHQISPTMIAQVMADYDGKWQALAAAARRKKFGDARPAHYKEWAKQARFLQQRGFASEQIEPYMD